MTVTNLCNNYITRRRNESWSETDEWMLGTELEIVESAE